MNIFTIYNTNSGVIEAQVGGSSMTISDVVLTDDQSVITGSFNSATQKIVDGEAVTYQADITGWLRTNRDAMLSSCDWTQGSDSPLSSGKKSRMGNIQTSIKRFTSKQFK
jgi:hypothetical protein